MGLAAVQCSASTRGQHSEAAQAALHRLQQTYPLCCAGPLTLHRGLLRPFRPTWHPRTNPQSPYCLAQSSQPAAGCLSAAGCPSAACHLLQSAWSVRWGMTL